MVVPIGPGTATQYLFMGQITLPSSRICVTPLYPFGGHVLITLSQTVALAALPIGNCPLRVMTVYARLAREVELESAGQRFLLRYDVHAV